jgi:hypothetical protein
LVCEEAARGHEPVFDHQRRRRNDTGDMLGDIRDATAMVELAACDG